MNPLVRRIYGESSLNFFVSPLHKRIASSVLGLEEEKGRVLPPLIDTEKFSNQHRERDIENLFVGVLSEAKGLENMRKMFSEKSITLIGKSVDGTRAFSLARRMKSSIHLFHGIIIGVLATLCMGLNVCNE